MTALMRGLAAEASGNLILVSILMDGGNDGLNTVIPITTKQYGAYSTLRQIPGNGGFLGVDLAAIAAAGTAFDPNYQTAADPNRTSHEVAKFDWATGSINKFGYTNLGWIGQAFDQIGGGGAIPPTVSLNYSSPTLLTGLKNAPLAMGGDIGNFSVPCGSGGADCATRLGDLSANDTYATQYLAGEFARSLASATTSYVGAVKGYAAAVPGTDYPATGNSSIRNQLKQIARMIRSGAPSRAYFADQGGYDTHSSQNLVTSHPALLADLSLAISDFYGYLKANGISQNVVIMTYSDFGRRVQANSTAGTDHGTSSVAFIVGDPVNPGVYGQYSDLTQLDRNGNPLIQVDFRNHISDLVSALGADPTAIVGSIYPKLGYI